MKTHHIIYNKILIYTQKYFNQSSNYFHHKNNIILITSHNNPTINTIKNNPNKN